MTMELLGIDMTIDVSEIAFALLALFSGIVTLIATQNVFNMYLIVIVVLVYGEVAMLRKAVTAKDAAPKEDVGDG